MSLLGAKPCPVVRAKGFWIMKKYLKKTSFWQLTTAILGGVLLYQYASKKGWLNGAAAALPAPNGNGNGNGQIVDDVESASGVGAILRGYGYY